MSGWRRTTNAKYGIVIYNFQQEEKYYLSLCVGDAVQILEENNEWYRGFNVKSRSVKGIFPKTYVHLKDARVESEGHVHETVIPKDLPIVSEMTTVLREWGAIWKQCYVDGNTENYELIRTMMLELITWRRQIMSGTLPGEEFKEQIQRVTSKIDYGNRKLGLDLVIRDDDGGIVDPTVHSTIAVFRMHELAVERILQETSDTNPAKLRPKGTTHSYSFFVTLKNNVCHVGSDAEVFLSLYDPKENKFISENFCVKWPASGLPTNFDMLDNCKVVFTDLGSKDLKREKIFLVCQIIRIDRCINLKKPLAKANSEKRPTQHVRRFGKTHSSGRMEHREGTSTHKDERKYTQNLRRPFGVAAMEVTNFIREKVTNDDEQQHFLPFQPVVSDADFLENVIKKVVSGKEVNAKGQGLWVTVKMLHGDVNQITKDYAYLVDQKTAIARKMGFPEVIMPVDVRNDIYVTLNYGDFDRGNKKSYKNVEVSVIVCDAAGKLIKDIICKGAPQELIDEFKSTVYYQVRGPRWFETIKVQLPIDVPIEQLHGTHLKFSFRHRSSKEAKDKDEKVFAISFLKLLHENGTSVVSGTHDLLVYKVDGKLPNNAKSYLELPATRAEAEARGIFQSTQHKGGIHHGGLSLHNKDNFQIATLVCSTKFPQNIDLLGLLKWRADPEFNVKDKLYTFMKKVDGEEIVKFLRDTLESLFYIWMENNEKDDYDDMIFDALVFVIQLIADKKYQHFGTVLDTYIKKHFSATLAYKKLMTVLTKYATRAEETEKQEPLFKALKALEYIFKFIIRSRVLFSQVNEGRGMDERIEFNSAMTELFVSINCMMKYTSTSDAILLCQCRRSNIERHSKVHECLQGAALKSLPLIIPEVMQVYDHKELSKLLKFFIENIPPDRLVRQKMICIDDIVHSKLFELPESRGILLQVITAQLKPLLERKEESHICVKVLSDIMEILYRKDIGPTHTDVDILMKELLRTVIQTVIFMDRDSQLIGNFVACMIGLLRQMSEYHYQNYISNFSNRTDLVDFLMEIFMVFKDLVSKNVFATDWAVMIMLQNSVILGAMKQFSQTLNKHFISEKEFEYQLYNNFFHLSVAFLTQEPLQLENFSTGKRNKIIEKYKDMRREVGIEIIRMMWYHLGGHKIRFIPEMVGPFLEVTLIPEVELRKATIPIFFDMMQCEFNNRHHFKQVESEVITQLDVLIEGGRGDEQYKDLFNVLISDLCSKHKFLCDSGSEFVLLVTRLLERLLDYRAIVTDENKENRMSCTVNLLNFYRDINRQEMYLRYLYKLCDLHLECDNHTEAAFTLQMHVSSLKWSDEMLLFHTEKYPNAHTQRQLKECLYYDIIEHFDNGKMWENGIILCKELVHQYETELFLYGQLSDLLKRQATFYDHIMMTPRPEPEYFRVGFYGQGYLPFLRNRVFVYRGKEYERLGDFNSRLQNMYPMAKLMVKSTTPPGQETKESKGQYLQIFTVHPVQEEHKRFKGKTVSNQILSYYKVNEVDTFVYSKPFRRGKKQEDLDFANQWLQRTYYKTKYKLPGILRWFEVVKETTKEVSPLEHAVETMEEQNDKLNSKIKQHIADPNVPLNPLSMQLNGIVDAAVQGGPEMYEKAFFSEEYLKEHPNDLELIERLKDAMSEQSSNWNIIPTGPATGTLSQLVQQLEHYPNWSSNWNIIPTGPATGTLSQLVQQLEHYPNWRLILCHLGAEIPRSAATQQHFDVLQ
uniref:Dedicator of cytokinesis protein 1 n=1 Tax=Saccoglossus kowalevskii TaxID=10224 RepID=A0ABM0N174_SACKO|nr:PREDICTED: dedicator of cytokinesis protein 1 [Saccoglossus kowalevskii]